MSSQRRLKKYVKNKQYSRMFKIMDSGFSLYDFVSSRFQPRTSYVTLGKLIHL